jgi:DNA-binding GntR family transcriptional regulator
MTSSMTRAEGGAAMVRSPPAAGSLATRAYAEIRDRIIRLELPPGAPIDEEALMAELGIGRTPVREAIKRLALESLVVVHARRGTFVTEVQMTDLAAISEVRVRLEGFAARLAAERSGDAERAEAGELLRDLRRSRGRAAGPLMSLDASVHRFLYRASGNSFLEDTLTRYFNLSFRIWHLVIDRMPEYVKKNVREHEALLRAVRDGRAADAEQIAADHVLGFERKVREVL